jgi:uncharacterized membrane protein
MAFCSNCGSAVLEREIFCSVCGAPVSSAIRRPAVPHNPATPPKISGAKAAMASNAAAALSYLLGFVTGIVFLVVEPYKRDKFVRFHAFQSILYSIAVVVFEIAWSKTVLAGMFSLGDFWKIVSTVSSLIWLGLVAFWIFLMYKAYNNDACKIPVIGEWAYRQALK